MIVSAGGIYQYPYMYDMGGNTTANAFTFDTSTDVCAVIFHIPATGTISNVHYRVSASTSPVLTLRTELRTVNLTTGLPDAAGTLYGSSTSITSANPTTGNKTAAVNCTGATAGDLAALVFDLSAFTSGSIALVQRLGGSAEGGNFPYQLSNTAAADVLSTVAMQAWAIEYGSHVYYPLEVSCICSAGWTAASSTVSNSGTTRRGNKFTPPFAMRACGMFVAGDLDGDCLLRLRLASDDSILATATIDKDVRGLTSAATGLYFFDAGATVSLVAGTAYYALLEGNSATSSSIFQLVTVEAQQLDQLSGGQNCFGVVYNLSYAPDQTTTRYNIGVLFNGLDDGSGVRASGTFMFGGL